MSDEAVSAPAEAEAPDIGQGEAEATPERTFLDADQYADHYVRVKVDGEDMEVPLNEALGGYSRTADYTRKTQQLAEQQREADFALTVQRALENNPAATIRLLQEQYGIGPDLQPLDEQVTEEDDLDFDDPVAQRLREQEARLGQWEAQQVQRELHEALWVLRNRYGEDFNPDEVVSRAAQYGRMDLEGVYKELAFEKMWARQQAEVEANRQREQEDAARTAAKATNAVHQGGSANAALQELAGNAPTLADAYYEAKRQLGM